MTQIVTKRDYDPTDEFTGIWFNTKSGSMFVWADKPVVIGHSEDGRKLRADIFDVEFVFEEKRNKQVYSYEFPYHGIPVRVVANVTQEKFSGTGMFIKIGEEYGEVTGEGYWLVAQNMNMRIGNTIKISCQPSSGWRRAKVIVLTYE